MRIVSLLPSATEIVCALGLQDNLVAVSHECDYPSEITSLPRITSSSLPEGLDPQDIDTAVNEAVQAGRALYQIDGDMLQKLQPDLIVTQGVCDVCAVGLGTVEATLKFLPDCLPEGAQTLSFSGMNFEGILRDIRALAEVAGREDEAATLITSLRERWNAVDETSLASRLDKPTTRPKVLMLEWNTPPFYGGHWVPEMVEAAGGDDILGTPGRASKRTTWAEIAKHAPDVIVVMACGYDLTKNVEFAEALYTHPEAKHLPAVKAQQVWACDANSYFSRPGPRVVRGAEMLRAILRGQEDKLSCAEARRVRAPSKPLEDSINEKRNLSAPR